MTVVAEAARAWQLAGVCTIPILPGGNKKPAISWGIFQQRRPTDEELTNWFGNGHPYGIALLMGKISGCMEMTELEGRVADRVSDITHACDRAGISAVWDKLLLGYTETSPNGGTHFIYRVEGMEVPGNKKIATRPATAAELLDSPLDKVKVLAETRGEGGYVVVAPTPGYCHSSGNPWVKAYGSTYGEVATLTAGERDSFHAVLREVLHQDPDYPDRAPTQGAPSLPPVPVIPSLPSVERGAGGELRPGDDFEQQVDWDHDLLLGGAGWRLHHIDYDGHTKYWVRPGKEWRDGHSASTGRDTGRERLFVFSTATEFPEQEAITKFRAYSILHHRGNDSAAASALRQRGYGDVLNIPGFAFDESIGTCRFTDDGNAAALEQELMGTVKWVTDEQEFKRYNGRFWESSTPEYIESKHFEIARRLLGSEDQQIKKWATRSLGMGAARAARDALKSRIACKSSAFDQDTHLLNLQNGTYNLITHEFLKHDPRNMITRIFCANYDEKATCEKFDSFMSVVLPDPELRQYVQDAMGSSLLPQDGRRAIFLTYGPSSTGKSQLLELAQHLFCDYGTTAPASTFRVKRDSTATNDLHCLRGKRFVATSETSDSAAFDEEVLKRLTGGDTMRTRELYQGFQDWVPECSVWIATNFPPRFTSDDNAVWRRAKLIPFMTVMGEGDAPVPIPGYARKHLVPEADGILNWLLAGLKAYQEHGLREPESVSLAANALRAENDSVSQFIEEQTSDGLLELGDPNDPRYETPTRELYASYHMWAEANSEKPVGRRRFINRLTNLPQKLMSQKLRGQMHVVGIRRPPGVGVLGTFHRFPEKILD